MKKSLLSLFGLVLLLGACNTDSYKTDQNRAAQERADQDTDDVNTQTPPRTPNAPQNRP